MSVKWAIAHKEGGEDLAWRGTSPNAAAAWAALCERLPDVVAAVPDGAVTITVTGSAEITLHTLSGAAHGVDKLAEAVAAVAAAYDAEIISRVKAAPKPGGRPPGTQGRWDQQEIAQRVRELLERQPDIPIKTAARELNIATSTARRHIEALQPERFSDQPD